ncbi:WD repeat-containing protein [Paramyrothecium foliicola]|nr:WD repeat-containing protein [Paramyrothecium foliicola]
MNRSPSPRFPDEGLGPLSLELRCRRSCSRSEITAVGISAGSSPSIYAIYAMAQTSQSWVDIFKLADQSALSMFAGTHAIFSPQGDRVATLKDLVIKLSGGVEYRHSSVVVIRDVATGKTVSELKDAHGEPLAWSRDGRILAVNDTANTPGSGRVSVWDVRSGNRVGRLMSHIDTVTHAVFTPACELVTVSRDGTARVSNSAAGKTISRLEVGPGASGNPRTLAVSPEGSTIASVWGSTVQLWLPRANHITSYNLGTVRATEGWPLCISPDCRYMACRTEDGFDIMGVASGTVLWEYHTETLFTAGAFSLDSKTLVLGTMDGNVEVWDMIMN